MLEQVVRQDRVERRVELIDHLLDLASEHLVVDLSRRDGGVRLDLDAGEEVDAITQRSTNAARATADIQQPSEAAARQLCHELGPRLAEVRRRLRVPRRILHRRSVGFPRMAASDQTWDEGATAEL